MPILLPISIDGLIVCCSGVCCSGSTLSVPSVLLSAQTAAHLWVLLCLTQFSVRDRQEPLALSENWGFCSVPTTIIKLALVCSLSNSL